MHTTPNCRGFTLLELMAVILIIGFSLGIASVAFRFNSAEDDVLDAIEKFLALADFAGERAALSNETTGLIMEPPEWQTERGQDADDIGWRYRWLTNSSEGWMPIPNVIPISLPPSIKIVVTINDELWDYEAQVDRNIPLAVFSSTGDLTPLEIEIYDEREPKFRQHLELDEKGELVWLEAPEPPEVDKDAF